MAKLIGEMYDIVHGQLVRIKVYSAEEAICRLSLTKKRYGRVRGQAGGMFLARERELKTTKEAR